MNKLLQRIVTAAVLFIILLVIFFILPYSAALLVLGGFVAIGAWEWSAFIGLKAIPARLGYAGLVVGLMALTNWLMPSRMPLAPLLWLALLWWGLAYLLILRFPLRISQPVAAVAGALVIVPFWAALVALFDLGALYILFVVMMVSAADIGAYFTGRYLGNLRLAPRVSPGKTWEGLFGGLAAALAIAYFGNDFFGWSPWFILPAAVSIALVSVVGDLTVSLFKRNAGLKDSGNLFPGHGGVLDRIDSVTAAVPLFVLELLWAGLI